MRKNVILKPVEYAPPPMGREAAEVAKPKPEDLLPWRLFAATAHVMCKKCRRPGSIEEDTFVAAKTREMADRAFLKNNGMCALCICNIMIAPDHRVRILDGGRLNPVRLRNVRLKGAVAQVAAREEKRMYVSPYRLWGFVSAPDKFECACGRSVKHIYTIAVSRGEALARTERYGQCALCMCETLTLDRYGIETEDGGPP